jgi:HK97 family phage major capsid protein
VTAEEQGRFDQMMKDSDAIRDRYEALEHLEDAERDLATAEPRKTTSPAPTPGPADEKTAERDRHLAFRAWALGSLAEPDSEEVRAAQRLGFNYARRDITGRLGVDMRALSVTNTSAGQYSVPDEMMRSFYEVQKWYGRVRSVSASIRTSGGNPLPWPKIDDTTNVGEVIAENAAVTTTADPTFGQIVLGAHKYSSKAVLVPVELLQDSSVNLAQYLGQALGTRIARIQNTHFTTGDGSAKPVGVATTTAGTVGKTAAATNAFTFDEVIDLVHSVDPAYRSQASFMLHDSIAAYARKLKFSGSGEYAWQPGLLAGQPDRMLGFPVTINNDCASAVTTGQKVILFGAFALAYLIRDAGDVIFARADELRLLNHQVVFTAFQRTDGQGIDTTAIKWLALA